MTGRLCRMIDCTIYACRPACTRLCDRVTRETFFEHEAGARACCWLNAQLECSCETHRTFVPMHGQRALRFGSRARLALSRERGRLPTADEKGGSCLVNGRLCVHFGGPLLAACCPTRRAQVDPQLTSDTSEPMALRKVQRTFIGRCSPTGHWPLLTSRRCRFGGNCEAVCDRLNLIIGTVGLNHPASVAALTVQGLDVFSVSRLGRRTRRRR